MNYNFNARGIYFSHGMHGNLSLRDVFLPTNFTNITNIYRCAMVFLDILEELGRCAVLDFVILVFRQGMVAFGILVCKDNNFF